MKARVVVCMHGGTISGVYVEDPELDLDVVFTERSEEAEFMDDEFEVKSGFMAGELIYTREESQLFKKEDLDGIFAAADKREKSK